MKSEKVWDIFVRTFHWTLVGSMIGLYLSGDNFESVHTILGYFVICLVLLRIIWGFIGTKHARFHDFIYRPSKIYHYLKSLINGNPTHYTGHNPAGGLMVIVMLLSLLVTAFTGLRLSVARGRGHWQMPVFRSYDLHMQMKMKTTMMIEHIKPAIIKKITKKNSGRKYMNRWPALWYFL